MSSPPRLGPWIDPPPEVAEILDKGLRHDGRPLNAAATIAHHPRLLKRFTVFAGLFLTHSVLPERDRELLTLRSAYLMRSDYYYGHHVDTGLAAGLTGAQIRALATEAAEDSSWTDRDRLLIEVADELLANVELSEPTWERLRAVYQDEQTVEAVMLVGFYRMLGGFANTLGVQRERGIPGWPEPALSDDSPCPPQLSEEVG
jgi:alkylhydroperoxidase family enzyme